MVAFHRTNGQAMVFHGLHLLCPHGEPRNPQSPHIRCELPTSRLRDLSVDCPPPQPAVSPTSTRLSALRSVPIFPSTLRPPQGRDHRGKHAGYRVPRIISSG